MYVAGWHVRSVCWARGRSKVERHDDRSGERLMYVAGLDRGVGGKVRQGKAAHSQAGPGNAWQGNARHGKTVRRVAR